MPNRLQPRLLQAARGGRPRAIIYTDAITLTALWDRAIGDGQHEVCAHTHAAGGAASTRRKRMRTSRVRQQKAVGSGVVVIRHGGRGNTQPAVDAQGVLRTIQILPSELPSVQSGRSPPLFVFKQKKNRTLQATT